MIEELFDTAGLAENGFAIVRSVVTPEVCRRARELIDDHLGPRTICVEEHVQSRGWTLTTNQTTSSYTSGKPRAPASDHAYWSTAPPFLQSRNYRHDIRHPVRGNGAGVLAELVTGPQLEACAQALRVSDPRELKLLQQFLIRTDHEPPPHTAHPGWHMDHSTLPWQRDATPSQHYFGALIALADIPAGNAAFTVAAGSMRRVSEIAERYVP
jgi:hypothetical protein